MAYIGKIPAAAALTASDITDGIISEAKMADDAISLTELKAGTDGEVISWDASGNPVAIGAGTSGHFLKSQGAGSQPVFAAAAGGKTIKRHYFEMNTRTAGSGGAGVQFNYTTSFIPIDPTAGNNDLWVQSTAPMKGDSGDWFWGGLRFAKSGGSNYDHYFKGIVYVDPNNYQTSVSFNYNISAGTLPAGTYTVSLLAGDSGSASSSSYFAANTSDSASLGGQTICTLMITEYKN